MGILDRICMGLLGASVIAAMTYGAVIEVGGFQSPAAFQIIVIGVAAAGGALVSGRLWACGWRFAAFVVFLGCICAELVALQRNAEHSAALRAEKIAPVERAQFAMQEARKRLAQARALQKQLQGNDERTAKAIAMQNEIRAAATKAALDRYCGKSCRENNKRQLENAANEVKAAQNALQVKRNAANNAVQIAMQELKDMPKSGPANALAAWLKIDPRYLSISEVSLTSLTMMFLGLPLLHFAGHSRSRSRELFDVDTTNKQQGLAIYDADKKSNKEPLALPGIQIHTSSAMEGPMETANAFLIDTFEQGDGQADVTSLHNMYLQWCKQTERSPHEKRKIAIAIGQIIDKAGYVAELDGERTIVRGLRYKVLSEQDQDRAA